MRAPVILHHRPWFFLVAIVPITAATACVKNTAQQSFERPPAPVQVAKAIAQDVPTYLDAIGKTVAREVVSIQPQVSGRIIKIHFADGSNIKRGALLFTIDPRPFEASLKQAQANLSKSVALKKQAEANLAREIAQAKWGLAQVERYRTLLEQGVVAREQYEQLRANCDSLKANVEAARAAVRSADEAIRVDSAAIESAKVQLGYCFIRSPIDGRAGQRLVDIGNLRATIPNVGHRFWPGRFVNIRLVLNTIRDAVLVPASAPQISAAGSYVYVVKEDSTAEQRSVTLGQRQGDLVVIENGVQAGEQIVTIGQLGVTPGGKVVIEQPSNAGNAATK